MDFYSLFVVNSRQVFYNERYKPKYEYIERKNPTMSNVIDVIKKRSSTRGYTPEPLKIGRAHV